MDDRVSRFPGRVRLTQVIGDVYDMELADGATVAGTNLNKATFLTDAVANTLRTMAGAATAPSTPNEAFQMMASFLSEKPIIRFGSYVGTGLYGQNNPNIINFTGSAKLKALYVLPIAGTYDFYGGFLWMRILPTGVSALFTNGSYIWSSGVDITWADNSISWYSAESELRQLNYSGRTYYYMAILEY